MVEKMVDKSMVRGSWSHGPRGMLGGHQNFQPRFTNHPWPPRNPGHGWMRPPNGGRGSVRMAFSGPPVRGPFPGPLPNHTRPRMWKKQSQRGGKKVKVNSRDLAENNAFFCDTCDRGYKTEEKFKEHCDVHEECTYTGCTFTAAPKLVQLHIRLQHQTGLAKKIWSLESKEDVQRWREDRRRNYPTAENQARKRQQLIERKNRGEVIETKQFGKFRERRQHGQPNNRQNHQRRPAELNSEPRADQEPHAKRCKTEDTRNHSMESETKHRDPSIDPLSYVLDDEKYCAPLPTPSTALPSQPVSLSGSLGSLMCTYGDMTDSEEEGEIKDEDCSVQHTPLPSVSASTHTFQTNQNTKWGKTSPKKRKRKGRASFVPKANPTLLEKLLANEIRHERNVILQCVRYIVKNNFFDACNNEVESEPLGTPKMDSETKTEDINLGRNIQTYSTGWAHNEMEEIWQ